MHINIQYILAVLNTQCLTGSAAFWFMRNKQKKFTVDTSSESCAWLNRQAKDQLLHLHKQNKQNHSAAQTV